MRTSVTAAALGSAAFLLTSCNTPGGGPLGLVMFDSNQHVSGAGPLFSPSEEGCATASFLVSAFSSWRSPPRERPECQHLRYRLQQGLNFTNLFAPSSAASAYYEKRRRNEAIATLIAASNGKCGQYVQFLQQYQGNVRATTGILSQATAILATVASGGTAQGLAATSGIASGAGSSLQQAHFQNQTVAMLTKAFDSRRSEMLRNMDGLMQCSIDQYPFARAFADVQNYHAACSIVVGLEEAQEAVEEKNSPSLDTFTKLLEKLPSLQKAMAKFAGRDTQDPPPAEGADDGAAGGAADNAGGGAADGQDGEAGGQADPADQANAAGGEAGKGQGQSDSGGAGDGAPSCPFTAGDNSTTTTTGLSSGS